MRTLRDRKCRLCKYVGLGICVDDETGKVNRSSAGCPAFAKLPLHSDGRPMVPDETALDEHDLIGTPPLVPIPFEVLAQYAPQIVLVET